VKVVGRYLNGDRMKAKFLLFESNHIVGLKDGEVVEGFAHVEDKSFSVDGAQPFLYHEDGLPLIGSDDYTPMYFVKWDDPNPKTLEQIQDIDEMDVKVEEMSPSELKAVSETNLFRGLFKMSPKSGFGLDKKKKIWLALGIGGAIFIVVYYLMWFGVGPFG